MILTSYLLNSFMPFRANKKTLRSNRFIFGYEFLNLGAKISPLFLIFYILNRGLNFAPLFLIYLIFSLSQSMISFYNIRHLLHKIIKKFSSLFQCLNFFRPWFINFKRSRITGFTNKKE